MTDELAAMHAWLEDHDLAEVELLHHLVNHGPDGADRLTSSERRLLSVLLEARRRVVPGYRPAAGDQSAPRDRPGAAAPLGLFDPGSIRPQTPAAVEPSSRRTRPSERLAARQRTPVLRSNQRDREERKR